VRDTHSSELRTVDDCDFERAGGDGLAGRRRPAGETGEPADHFGHRRQRSFGGVTVVGPSGEGRMRDQCPGHRGRSGGGRVVGRILWPADEPLGVVGGVVEATVAVGEVGQG